MTPQDKYPHFTAELSLLSTEAGGRRNPIASGYRCNCWLSVNHDDDRSTHDATFRLVQTEQLSPGESGIADVVPHVPSYWRQLRAGSKFELREGPRKIGHGVLR